jgi:hypothetical protein
MKMHTDGEEAWKAWVARLWTDRSDNVPVLEPQMTYLVDENATHFAFKVCLFTKRNGEKHTERIFAKPNQKNLMFVSKVIPTRIYRACACIRHHSLTSSTSGPKLNLVKLNFESCQSPNEWLKQLDISNMKKEFDENGVLVVDGVLDAENTKIYADLYAKMLSGEVDSSAHRHDLASYMHEVKQTPGFVSFVL